MVMILKQKRIYLPSYIYSFAKKLVKCEGHVKLDTLYVRLWRDDSNYVLDKTISTDHSLLRIMSQYNNQTDKSFRSRNKIITNIIS